MFRPLDDNILVKENTTQETQTPSGFYIPETAQAVNTTRTGEVVAVGPGKTLESGERLPLDVLVGNVVVLSSFAGSKITLNREDFVVVKQNKILGVVSTPKEEDE